jgi:dienelactone hydrolase
MLLALCGSASAAPSVPSQDPFYSYSGSLSGVAPGTVLRSRTVIFELENLSVPVKTTQVLYRTTSELGAPIADVATVIQPLVGLQAHKLVSWQMAYDGLASNCDPSFAIQGGTPTEGTNTYEQALLVPLLAAGYPVVTADYEGESEDFVAGRMEGMGTLDGIRAAEQLLKLPAAGTQVGIVGYSGGAIATDWAAELAPSYAPALDIVGAAYGGITVDLAHNLPYVNGSPVWSGAIPAALVGIARGFDINLSGFLSPHGMQIAEKVGTTCLGADLGAYPGLTYQSLLKPQYTNIDQVKPALDAINDLIMSTGGTPREPLFLGVGNADGTGDGVMVAADDEALAHTYCQRGVPVQFTVYKGDDHATAAVAFLPAAGQFLLERLAGLPFTSGCSSIGAGNSLAPLKYTPVGLAMYRLTVAPARVPRGRLARLRFTLSKTVGGRASAVSGAVIRFASRMVRTGSAGGAVLRVRVRRVGVYVARASVGGTQVASARVRVTR